MALAMLSVCSSGLSTEVAISLRVGIDTGPVVAGVIGRSKFIYDLWGDTVNTASRMESHGLPNAIQVTRAVHERLRDGYLMEPRGTIDVKGKGPMPTWLLLGARSERPPLDSRDGGAADRGARQRPVPRRGRGATPADGDREDRPR